MRVSPTLALALALPLAGALASPADAFPSGLPWKSGAKSSSIDGFGTWRGRPADVRHEHVNPQTNGSGGPGDFATIVQSFQGWVGTEIASGPPDFLASPALLPPANKGQFSQCASGAFDGSWTAVGLALKKAAGTAHTVHLELGYEAAIGSSSHSWGVDTASQVPSYVACWKHVAAVVRAAFPGGQLRLVWNNARKFGTTLWTVASMDPGVEDEYGLMCYDSSSSWAAQYSSTNSNGDPTGYTNWLNYARGKGKQLGCSEWGVESVNGDNPTYITNMYNFFTANAASIAYDTYQNTSPHTIDPVGSWPNSSARYQSTW